MNLSYRVEIVSNQSVMDDVIEAIEQEITDIEYTIIENVHGKGLSSKKLGNTVWPEMNFLLFTYTNEDAALKIKEIMSKLRERFPREGISCFISKVETL